MKFKNKIRFIVGTIFFCVMLLNMGTNGTKAYPNPDSSLNSFTYEDNRAISIMENTGTWGPEINRLLPNMTAEAVDRIVFVYLERQLFPGISTPTNARRVSEVIQPALRRMTENGRKKAQDIVSSYY